MNKRFLWLLLFAAQIYGDCRIYTESKLERDDNNDDDEVMLEIEVPDSALLYAAPSNAHTETILVRNAGTEAVTAVYVSHRERYVPLDGRHVELVNSIEPKYIPKIDFNETAEVTVNFAVPHYVKPRSQSIVTVVVSKVTVGEPNGHDKFERSFRFTVSDGPLSQFDDAPPACGANEVCANRAACHALGPFSSCNETFWNGELTVKDNVTGVRRVTGDAHVREIDYVRPLEIGTIRALRVGIEADCCREGVTLRVEDMAGNFVDCPVGQVSGATSSKGAETRLLIMLSLFILLYTTVL